MSLVMSGAPETPAQPATEGQPQEVEAPKEAPQVESKAKHFAALAKKERMLVKEKEAIRAERARIEQERAEIRELMQKFGQKPSSPKEALERYGFSYRDATEYELNDNQPTAEQVAKQAQEEVRRLREENEARDRRNAELAAKQAEQEKAQLVNEFREEIKEFAQEKSEDYELINFHDAYDVVYETIDAHFRKTGKLLSIPEGANMVEKFLEKRMGELQATKKFAKTRQGDPSEPENGFSRQPQTAQKRTLDNNLTSSTPTLVKSSKVEDDRIRRALAALGG